MTNEYSHSTSPLSCPALQNLANLVTLQNRNKMLKAVCIGSYRPSSTEDSIEAAVQNQVGRVDAIDGIIRQMFEEYPQHQGALRKLSRTLTEYTKAPTQGSSSG